MTTTYRLIPGSELTLTIDEARQTETWDNPKTHFIASWNGDIETVAAVPTGTGVLISFGWQPAPPMLIDEWQAYCPKNVLIPLKSSDYTDDKPNTNDTGGSERGFVCIHQDRFAWGRADWQNAYKALVGFNMDQFRRPYSMVPWQFGDKLSEWQSSGRTANSKVEGWNRTDRAHASRPQLYALAKLGSDLGLMMCALEWRTLATDWLMETKYVLNQPREVAWMFQWCDWAEELGFNDSQFPNTVNGDPFFPKPAVIRMQLITLMNENWWLKHPIDKAASGQRTDAKVMPRSTVGENEIAGDYTWQEGLLATAMTRMATVPAITTPIMENLYRGFRSQAVLKDQRWCESTGTTEFATPAEAQAVVDGVLKDEDRLKLRIWNLPNGKCHIVKPRSSDDAYFFSEAFARMYGLSHPACLAMIREFGSDKTKNYGLSAGFWRMLELAGEP